MSYGKTGDGRYMFASWQKIAEAIRDAKQIMDPVNFDPSADIPTAEWNLIGTAIECHQEGARRKCFNCTDPIDDMKDIRCLDCRMVFCPDCAAKHFWPNGRAAAPTQQQEGE